MKSNGLIHMLRLFWSKKITGKDLEDLHTELHKNIMDSIFEFTILVKQETYDVLYIVQSINFSIFSILPKKIKLQYHNRFGSGHNLFR